MRYIVVGNSPKKSFKTIYKPKPDDIFVGLDEGALEIIDQGYPLHLAIGDFDKNHRLDEIKKFAFELSKYSTIKNETDLELFLMQKPNHQIIIYDATGGRLDHEILNFKLLEKYDDLNITIKDENNEVKLYKEGLYNVSQDDFEYVSIIPLTDIKISILKGKYLLTEQIIKKNETYTTSNSFVDKEFSFKLDSGRILLIKSR